MSENALTPALLVVTAVEAEAAAVLATAAAAETVSIGPYRAARTPAMLVLAGGIGPAAAGAATAAALALLPEVRLVLSVGVAGGFAAAGVQVAAVALATASIFADLGADSPGGFRPGSDFGWTAAGFPGPPALLAAVADSLRTAGLAVHTGPILTISTVTGTAARAALLSAAHRPVAEAMEGAAVAATADRFGRPCLELRTVSNLVGDRDRSAWDIPAALQTLRHAMAAAMPALREVLG